MAVWVSGWFWMLVCQLLDRVSLCWFVGEWMDVGVGGWVSESGAIMLVSGWGVGIGM